MNTSKWRKQQNKDSFFKRAQSEGWRSRAVFKLEEIDKKYHLLQSGLIVIDLGASPGSWSQYAAKKVLPKGRVIALDLLKMDLLSGVDFIQTDFAKDEAVGQINAVLQDHKAGLVMSDIAPNISGVRSIDQPKSMHLAELALDLCYKVLKYKGNFLIKIFQGEGFDPFVAECRKSFKNVRIVKPKASRPESREVYLVATGSRL
ncbi:MAG: SAM-dependent methyltransferase [Pseudomonadota bacterium]|nr:SAM-dependent methyltransferase [Pseudomonadota bacterium]